MLRLLSKSKEENKKKRILTNRLLIIKEWKIRKNLRPSKKLKESEKKKSAKFKDLESFKRRQQIDKLKLMPLELREHLKRVRETPEKEKSSRPQRDKEFRLIWRSLDKSNSKRKLLLWLNRQELKERTTCIKFKNRNKLSCKREKLRKIENKL